MRRKDFLVLFLLFLLPGCIQGGLSPANQTIKGANSEVPHVKFSPAPSPNTKEKETETVTEAAEDTQTDTEKYVEEKLVKPSLPTSKKTVLSIYDAAVGKELAQKIRTFKIEGIKCGGTKQYGKCFLCVGRLLGTVKNSNKKIIWPKGVFEELNKEYYARSFAAYFKPEKHQEAMRLMEVSKYLKPTEAPEGTIVVVDKCSDDPAGDIYIVSSKNGVKEACADFCRSIKHTCSNPKAKVIGVFIPY